MMVGILGIDIRMASLLRSKRVKKRTIIVGLKSNNCGREMLLQLLTLAVKPGDSVLAIHVQVSNDTFDPNTFHIHEDLCKSKQVDLQVKVCVGESYISELTRQVRVNYATILALGCNTSGPRQSVVNICLKRLPPTCFLLVLDSIGRILVEKQGTSQQGSSKVVLQTSLSLPLNHTCYDQSIPTRNLRKSLTTPSPSMSSSTPEINNNGPFNVKKTVQVPDIVTTQKPFQRSIKHFTSEELSCATSNFSPAMVIGEGGHSKVYRANLEDGRAAAVKVLKNTHSSAADLLREVGLLSGIKHEHIVQMIGYCNNKDMYAIVYDQLEGSLKQNLRQLSWSERIVVAIGLAKALQYLHHSCNPPVIHRDVKSSNILLSDNCQPQLTDFGSALVLHQSHQAKPFNVVGTFGYMAPEYMMFGTVDEKTDVYSFGVVLLELITGKEAIQTNLRENLQSLVLWARSLLSCGLCERLIDPTLLEDYKKEEMETMMFAARLCLLHSSPERPTMEMILRLFEEPEYRLKMHERDKSLDENSSRGERGSWRHDDSVTDESIDDCIQSLQAF
ncbi:protein kinase STUNTED-like [Corylus avellana]|uniref:protein kinase STUNTED-like n=1 Tax=Corylus avellana TaxID=13451 RepID=UPI00286B4958|nr:protein kinase STUNTED-like [Corylus avellana]